MIAATLGIFTNFNRQFIISISSQIVSYNKSQWKRLFTVMNEV